jgi:molybdopterin-guanine dinucleotide biosynthesis protein A
MNATLAVLAGGEGSRMGRPKAELCVSGVPILEYLLKRFDWPGEKVLVTAPGREHPPGHQLFDREVIDPVAGEGPLRGIVTALDGPAAGTIFLFVTCDMPLVTRDMLTALQRRLRRDSSLMGLMMQSESAVEPFPLGIRSDMRDQLLERLQQGERSVWKLAERPDFRCMRGPEDPEVWTNLNDPDDFRNFVLSVPGPG